LLLYIYVVKIKSDSRTLIFLVAQSNNTTADTLTYLDICILIVQMVRINYMKITVFYDVMPCGMVDVHQGFEGTFSFLLHDRGRTHDVTSQQRITFVLTAVRIEISNRIHVLENILTAFLSLYTNLRTTRF
jgi:hypothetical protein